MRFRWRIVGFVVLGATLAAAFSATMANQVSRMAGREPDITNNVILNGTWWYGWVLLAIPLVALSANLRIDRRPWVAVPVHAIAMLAAGTAHVALATTSGTYTWWRSLVMSDSPKLATFSFTNYWAYAFPLDLARLIDWELVAGAAIIGFAHAAFYYRETQHRALLNAQLETRLVAAHLRTLQAQLHPHFLFNTLHAISVLMHRDVPAADRMLIRLSDLLRMTLDSAARPEIRVSEEMDFLSKYLQIEQVRLGDRLSVRFDVDNDVLDAMVPALILQPLVENAIKHGIAPDSRPGRIAISARKVDEMLVMTVSDTGPGPSEGAMASLSTGIGVSNTRARLTTIFGARFRFEFQRHRDGFTVLVALPVRQEPATAAAAHVA